MVLPSVVQLDAPTGLENVVAILSPLTPMIRNKTLKIKQVIGMPNKLVILCFI